MILVRWAMVGIWADGSAAEAPGPAVDNALEEKDAIARLAPVA